jgi:short-subunit dehydrogenase
MKTDVKIAIVTGAASGLGLALCRELLRRGHRVAMFSRDVAKLEKEAVILGAEGQVLALPGDVTDANRVREAVEHVETAWGPIHLAIANAGLRHATWANEFPLQWAKELMETNYFGTLHLFDAVIPRMLGRKQGCFVGIASLAGTRCLPGGSGYGASKAAVQSFLDTVRLELGPQGIQVVTVNPWFIRTSAEDEGIPRPLMVEAEWAATTIVSGVEAGKTQIEFPFLPSLAWKLIRVLPNTVFAWLFRHRQNRSSIGLRIISFATSKQARRGSNSDSGQPPDGH